MQIFYKESDEECFLPRTVSNYKDGERVLATKEEFLNNFNKMSYGVFEGFNNWNNILIAGGSISRCVCTNGNIETDKMSDIDIFIYSEKCSDARDAFKRLLKHFGEDIAHDVVFHIKKSIIDVVFKDIKLTIQLIYSDYKYEEDIIKNFDANYVKVAYDGNKLICTESFLKCLETQTTVFYHNVMHRGIQIKRVQKTLKKGYSIKEWNPTFVVGNYDRVDQKDSAEIVECIQNKKLEKGVLDIISSYTETDNGFLQSIADAEEGKYDDALIDKDHPDYWLNEEVPELDIKYQLTDNWKTANSNFSFSTFGLFINYYMNDRQDDNEKNRKILQFENMLTFENVIIVKVEKAYNTHPEGLIKSNNYHLTLQYQYEPEIIEKKIRGYIYSKNYKFVNNFHYIFENNSDKNELTIRNVKNIDDIFDFDYCVGKNICFRFTLNVNDKNYEICEVARKNESNPRYDIYGKSKKDLPRYHNILCGIVPQNISYMHGDENVIVDLKLA